MCTTTGVDLQDLVTQNHVCTGPVAGTFGRLQLHGRALGLFLSLFGRHVAVGVWVVFVIVVELLVSGLCCGKLSALRLGLP